MSGWRSTVGAWGHVTVEAAIEAARVYARELDTPAWVYTYEPYGAARTCYGLTRHRPARPVANVLPDGTCASVEEVTC